MSGVECPKCGRATQAGAIICPGCDYILDASFLGDDITDDERDDRRRGRGAARSSVPTPQRIDFGEDAMILGKVDEADVSSFHSRDAGVSQREVTQTRFYVGGAVAQLMEPHAIPELAGGVGGASIRMTPFERHVMGFINGRRSIGRILKKSGMEEAEFKTAVAMLADKGFIRLKGWKKPRPGGHSTIGGSSRTGSMLRAAPQPAPELERTVVVHVEPAKSNVVSRRSAKPVRPATPKSISGLPSATSRAPSVSTPPRSPSEQARPAPPPPPPAATVVRGAKGLEKSADDPTGQRPKVVVPSGRFASLRAEVPSASEGSHAERRARGAAAEAEDRWEIDDNRSSVFAEGPPTAVGSADAALDSAAQRAEILAVLNDATGIGDALGPSDEAGLPAQENADDEEDEPPFASAEALSSDVIELAENGKATGGALSKDDFDVHVVSDASRFFDRATLPPGQRPVAVSARARSNGDDAGDGASTHSQGLKARRPMTLPPSALAPVEPSPSPPTPRAAPPGTATVTPPTPATAKPMGAPASPNKPTVTTTPPPPRATAAQAPLPTPPAPTKATTPQAAGPAPALGKPPPPPRVSASSQVSFELRKKAERIYEQALKDHAEGRISSALMNARLAMNFDPTVETYRTLHEELSRHKVAPNKAAAAGARPQELVLFEQASEAEGRGEHAKAVSLLEQAIAMNPRAAALYNRLGVLLSIRLKRHEEALVHLKKAVELEPGSVVYMNNFSKVTGLLESLIQRAPRKKGGAPQDDRVAVKKIRPKIF
jgi:hypothetical protein